MGTFSFVEFMREGGWGMWPVLLIGLVSLAAAIRYAVRPERLHFRFAAALWLTLLVAVAHASLTDVAAVLGYFDRFPDPAPHHPGPQGVHPSGGAGRDLPDPRTAAGRRRDLPRGDRPNGHFFLGIGIRRGTPFFSRMTRSPPSLHEPLIVLPSSLRP